MPSPTEGFSAAMQELWRMIEQDRDLVKILGQGHHLCEIHVKRFLDARKGDVKAAYEQFKETAQWRHENDVDNVLKTKYIEEDCYKYVGAACYHGEDKEGRPMYIERTGLMKNELLFDLIGNEGIIKAHIRHDEYLAKLCRDASVKHNKVIYKSCSIYDLTGFSLYLSSKEIEIFKSIAQMDGRYYPESLGMTYVINAPWLAMVAWHIIKGFLDPVTRSKVLILGGDYKKKLAEVIDVRYLPAEYGGTSDLVLPFPGYLSGSPPPSRVVYSHPPSPMSQSEGSAPLPSPSPSISVDRGQAAASSGGGEGRGERRSRTGSSENGIVLPKTAPRWKPDSEASKCMASTCSNSFGVYIRKHHCRMCGGIYCYACSSKQRRLPFTHGKVSRVCDECALKIDVASSRSNSNAGTPKKGSVSRSNEPSNASSSAATPNRVTGSIPRKGKDPTKSRSPSPRPSSKSIPIFSPSLSSAWSLSTIVAVSLIVISLLVLLSIFSGHIADFYGESNGDALVMLGKLEKQFYHELDYIIRHAKPAYEDIYSYLANKVATRA